MAKLSLVFLIDCVNYLKSETNFLKTEPKKGDPRQPATSYAETVRVERRGEEHEELHSKCDHHRGELKFRRTQRFPD